jgi:hypothetical protein
LWSLIVSFPVFGYCLFSPEYRAPCPFAPLHHSVVKRQKAVHREYIPVQIGLGAHSRLGSSQNSICLTPTIRPMVDESQGLTNCTLDGMLNSTTWLYGAEVLPINLRSKVMGLAAASHFIVNVGSMFQLPLPCHQPRRFNVVLVDQDFQAVSGWNRGPEQLPPAPE